VFLELVIIEALKIEQHLEIHIHDPGHVLRPLDVTAHPEQ
jgi:hypothetical protein